MYAAFFWSAADDATVVESLLSSLAAAPDAEKTGGTVMAADRPVPLSPTSAAVKNILVDLLKRDGGRKATLHHKRWQSSVNDSHVFVILKEARIELP